MNYACFSDRSFTTQKKLSKKAALSPEAAARRAFIRSHKFSVKIDPSTQKAEVKITKVSNE